MIKCKANPKKGVKTKVRGSGALIALETLAVVKAVVTEVKPEFLRQMIANELRGLLDELEQNAADEPNATTDTEDEDDEDDANEGGEEA